jgi:hypothetical protein
VLARVTLEGTSMDAGVLRAAVCYGHPCRQCKGELSSE